MAPAIEQVNRRLRIETSLGKDKLLILGFSGEESVSKLYSFDLELASRDTAIDPKSILGASATIQLDLPGGGIRYFHGLVVEFSAGATTARNFRLYRARLVPKLWLLSYRQNSRIFQNKSVPDIVDKIFADHGLSDYKKKLAQDHPAREYCVQYQESDLAFVLRLLEEEGIFFYFTHESNKHQLLLGDHKGAYEDAVDGDVDYGLADTARGRISAWQSQYMMRPGKWTSRDYNFEQPDTDLTATRKSILQLQGADKLEFFEYPGGYSAKKRGETLTSWRMDAVEAGYRVAHGESDVRSLQPGARFQLNHSLATEAGKFVPVEVSHAAQEQSLSGEGFDYSNRFSAIPADTVYRPEQRTERPLMLGPQTAVVVGPAGEEIFCDKYGRIKVQFFWDREGKRDENSTCWIRLAQPLAGNKWGGYYIPRIGMEVLVDFVDGDPDQPIVVGCVTNAKNMPVYGLPGDKTRTGIMTRSSLKGGEADYNELRFEDKKGSEEVYFHAQKDFSRVVENNDSLEVQNDRTVSVKHDESVSISNERTLKVGNSETANWGLKYSLSAGQQIELKVGQSSILIDNMGVTIKGMMIKIEGTLMTEIKGLMSEVNGSAMLTVRGGLIMIN